jgi:hypothetical protein
MTKTKAPWIAKDDEVCIISKEDDQSFGMAVPIARMYGDNANENAKFIALACNSHNDLVGALYAAGKRLTHANKHIDCQEEIDAIHAALEKAMPK